MRRESNQSTLSNDSSYTSTSSKKKSKLSGLKFWKKRSKKKKHGLGTIPESSSHKETHLPETPSRRDRAKPGQVGTNTNEYPSHISASPADVSQISMTSARGAKQKQQKYNNNTNPAPLLPPLLGEENTQYSSDFTPKSTNQSGNAAASRSTGLKFFGSTSSSVTSSNTSSNTLSGGNFLTRTKAFQNLVDWAFELIDFDKSGNIDKTEMYSGMLMIHLRLAAYAGPAACRPVTREYSNEIFDKVDADKSGTLDKKEFSQIMTAMCTHIVMRVVCQWAFTIIIVPLLAEYIYSSLVYLSSTVYDFTVKELREFDCLGLAEEYLKHTKNTIIDSSYQWILKLVTLQTFNNVKSKFDLLMGYIPDSVWEGRCI